MNSEELSKAAIAATIYGIVGTPLRLFTSHLTKRKQYCQENGHKSNLTPFTVVFLRACAWDLSSSSYMSMTLSSASKNVPRTCMRMIPA